MRRIRTRPGATYLLSDGRLTREAACDPYLPPELQLPEMTNRPFVNLTTPTVGESWRFALPGKGPIITTPVLAVEDYCAICDVYGCELDQLESAA